jgi:hypothetical protein
MFGPLPGDEAWEGPRFCRIGRLRRPSINSFIDLQGVDADRVVVQIAATPRSE